MISAWAAKHNGKLLMLDSASFRSSLKAFLMGSRVNLQASMRFLGKRKNLRLRMAVPDLKGRLFDNMWAALKKSL